MRVRGRIDLPQVHENHNGNLRVARLGGKEWNRGGLDSNAGNIAVLQKAGEILFILELYHRGTKRSLLTLQANFLRTFEISGNTQRFESREGDPCRERQRFRNSSEK